MKEIVATLPTPGSLLDVGCADGRAMKMALEVGWAVSGVEPDDVARQEASQYGTVYPAIYDVSGRFDVVLASHVLEHVADPVEFMSAMKDRLRVDGELMVVVPDSVTGRTIFHTVLLSIDALKLLFHRVGLKIVRSGLIGKDLLVVGQNVVYLTVGGTQ